MKMKIAAVLLALAALLPGCAREIPAPAPSAQMEALPVAEGKELFALAETKEEAEKIAGLYGIELVEFSNGVAAFHTEENLGDVIARGEKNGWPPLEVNTVQQLD